MKLAQHHPADRGKRTPAVTRESLIRIAAQDAAGTWVEVGEIVVHRAATFTMTIAHVVSAPLPAAAERASA